jgi:hypothetical protein
MNSFVQLGVLAVEAGGPGWFDSQPFQNIGFESCPGPV